MINHGDSLYPGYDVRRMVLYLYHLPPTNPNLILTVRKTSDKPEINNHQTNPPVLKST